MRQKKFISIIYLTTACFLFLLPLYLLINGGILPKAFYGVVMLSGILILYASFRFRKSENFRHKALHTGLAVLMLCYLVGETVTNSLIFTKRMPAEIPAMDLGFGVFNGPCAEYDSARGFRWTGDAPRISKIINNHIVYDRNFKINNRDFYFNRDYTYKKDDSLTKRYLVFGDSFSSGEYLEKPWPVRFNEIAGPGLELYSFCINGGGLFNWYSTFFKEVVPNYEFDGIIFAVFANDLERDFFVMQHEPSTGYTGYLDTVPDSWQDIKNHFSDRLNTYATYLPDSVIDLKRSEAIRFAEQRFLIKPDTYAFGSLISLPFLVLRNLGFRKFLDSNFSDVATDYDPGIIESSLGKKKSGMLREMVTWCRANDKQVIMSTVPYEPALQHLENGKELSQMAVCKAVSNHFELPFFDGMSCFSELDKKKKTACFLPFDIHWSQEGSDVFADEFFRFFKDNVQLPD